MSRRKQGATGAVAGLVLLLSLTTPPARAQPQPSQPFAPDWAMFAGGKVFAEKGCGKCHALRGFGGGVGPDLGRIQTGKSFFELGAAMWNHSRYMEAEARRQEIAWPVLTGQELADVARYLESLARLPRR